jgi:tetratricopeptide (TPR) repeat protein
MRRAMVGAAVLILATAASGSVFERYLSPDRPADRAIMNYLALAKSGRASSMDLADLGVLIFEKGFPGDAEDYLKAALKLDKHNYEAAYRLGLVLQRQGRDREAVRYYKMTLKQRRGYAEARFMLAMAEERCGRREAAIRDYAKAYRYAPQLADPKKNPLVYDSHLQIEAVLRHYQESAGTSTLPVTEIDPAEVRRMMEARPQAAPAPQPATAPVVAPAAAPAAHPPSPAQPAPPAHVLPGGLGAAPPRPAAPSPAPTPTR